MIRITEKSRCCGCTACANACPKGAIAMKADGEGFLYPSVDMERCVDCGLCERVCPVLHHERAAEETKGYIVRYKNADVVQESTSGGAFTAFAEKILSREGIVYGTGYDADMNVICKAAKTPAELAEMRGSKFVQSDLGSTFKEIKTRLREGFQVLFTGTPCQVAGLVSYLGGKPENLYCIDFVCRGVPSPGLWRNYVGMMEKKYGAKMVGARFKHKTYGYHATTMKIDFEGGKTWYGSGRVDPMMKAFVREMASRPSCHDCAFKTLERVSDLTMFDCYKFSEITGQHDDERGYSCLFVHSREGAELFGAVREQLFVLDADVETLIEKNGIMVRNSARPHPRRAEFYRLAAEKPIDEAIAAVEPITAKDRLIERAKGILFKTGLIRVAKRIKREKNVRIQEKRD